MNKFQFSVCNFKWFILEVRKSFAHARLRYHEFVLRSDPRGREKMEELGMAMDFSAPHWNF